MESEWTQRVHTYIENIHKIVDLLEEIPLPEKPTPSTPIAPTLPSQSLVNSETRESWKNRNSVIFSPNTNNEIKKNNTNYDSIPFSRSSDSKIDTSNEKNLHSVPYGHRFLRFLDSTSHKGSIHCLLKVNDNVWGGCIDGRITIWNVRTGKLIGSRQAHKGRLFLLTLVDGNVWSAADDNRIKVWTTTAIFEREINFNFSISSMVFTGTHVWCGNKEEQSSTIVVYKPDSLMTIENVIDGAGHIRYLFFDQITGYIWACSLDIITRIDSKTYQIIDQINGSRINSMVLVEASSTVWACSSDSTIYVYDRKSGELVRHLKDTHDSVIFTLMAHGNYVWSGGWDRYVRIWDANTYKLMGSLQKIEIISAIIIVPIRIWIKKKLLVSNSPSVASLENPYDLVVQEYEHKYLNNGTQSAAANQQPNNNLQLTNKKNQKDDAESLVCGEIYTVWVGAWDGTIAIWV